MAGPVYCSEAAFWESSSLLFRPLIFLSFQGITRQDAFAWESLLTGLITRWRPPFRAHHSFSARIYRKFSELLVGMFARLVGGMELRVSRVRHETPICNVPSLFLQCSETPDNLTAGWLLVGPK